MVKRLLSLSLLCALPFTSSADYVITDSQMTALELRLDALATDNETLQKQATQSKRELNEVKTQLVESKRELTKVKQYSNETSELLKNAEQSLKTYEKTVESKNKRIKWLQIILAGTVVYAVSK